ncbi:MAG: hypothetical protein U0841_03105 [Chloroflexia bacterium]
MTGRKSCGSCRFFEASTVQGHGWCRNPDYQGRDDTVLLRAEELACRTGWQKDHWQVSGNGPLVEMVAAAAPTGESSGTLPIGQGIGSLAAADAGVQAAKAALVAARPTPSAFPAGRRRGPQPAAAGVMTSVAASRQGQEMVSVVASALQNHPELGPSGEVLRRPSRSVVAEAHRKALERRENERETVEGRRKEQQAVALASLYSSSKPVAGAETAPRAPEVAAPPTRQPSLATGVGGTNGAYSQTTAPQASATPSAPREPEDRQIITERPALQVEAAVAPPRQDLTADLPPAASLGVGLTSASATRLPDPVIERAPRDVASEASTARYWDDPNASSRFSRMMRPEPTEIPSSRPVQSPQPQATTQQVSNVGRVRAEQPLPVETPPPAPTERTIRSLSPRGGSLTADPESAPTQPAPRIPRTTPAVEARPTEPAMPTLPPRQIDEQLLQQLQQDWRERTLAAYAGQRCGTCRYFQAHDGASQGSCACPFAGSYRQQQGRQDLGCINSFGTWWAANDDGWLQKADLGQRQPTPMVDQLLKEWGIPDAPPAATERRREAR